MQVNVNFNKLCNSFVSGTARTNNKVEGWNRRFSSLIGADHPSLWKFIDKLRQEQSYNEFRLHQAAAGIPPPPKRIKYRDLDARLATTVSKFGIPLADYLNEV